LTALLTSLDAVESEGQEKVRFARKELVLRIEAALEKVENAKSEAWTKQRPAEATPTAAVNVTAVEESTPASSDATLSAADENVVKEEAAINELVSEAEPPTEATSAVDELATSSNLVQDGPDADEGSSSVELSPDAAEPLETLTTVENDIIENDTAPVTAAEQTREPLEDTPTENTVVPITNTKEIKVPRGNEIQTL